MTDSELLALWPAPMEELAHAPAQFRLGYQQAQIEATGLLREIAAARAMRDAQVEQAQAWDARGAAFRRPESLGASMEAEITAHRKALEASRAANAAVAAYDAQRKANTHADTRPGALGMFGHHPDPAIDFEIEVEELQSIAWDFDSNIPTTEDPARVMERFNKALAFRFVPGGECQPTMDVLRSVADAWAKWVPGQPKDAAS